VSGERSATGSRALADIRRSYLTSPLNHAFLAHAFKAAFKAVIAEGYAVENEEVGAGVSCIAAPILNGMGIAIAAISVPGPTARIMIPSPVRIGVLVRSHGDDISRLLGSRPAS